MVWTAENRGRYDRRGQRYPSDLTNEEWAVLQSLLPVRQGRGRPRAHRLREVMNGIRYVVRHAQGPAAVEHLPRLLAPAVRRRPHGADQPSPGDDGPRKGGPGGEPDVGNHRRPNRSSAMPRRGSGERMQARKFLGASATLLSTSTGGCWRSGSRRPMAAYRTACGWEMLQPAW